MKRAKKFKPTLKAGLKCRFCGSYDVTWNTNNISDTILAWRHSSKRSICNGRVVKKNPYKLDKNIDFSIDGKELNCHSCKKVWAY